MKKSYIMLLVLVLTTVFSVSVWAYPVPEVWKMKFANVEVVTPEPYPGFSSTIQTYFPAGGNTKEDNWGLFQISSIWDHATDTQLWSSGEGGQVLTGMFWGLANKWTTAVDIDADGAHDSFTGFMQTATSSADTTTLPDLDGDGVVDAGLTIWLNDGSTPYGTAIQAGPGGRTADGLANTYAGITYGTKQADFILEPGIYAADGSIITTVVTNAFNLPFSGDGVGYMDFVPGSGPLADLLIPDAYTTPHGLRDVYMEFDFRPAASPRDGYGWDLDSDDPLIGAAIPEPCTLLLLGSGLLGCGFGMRRKLRS